MGMSLRKTSEAEHNASLRPLEKNRQRYLSYLQNDLANPKRAVLIAIDEGEPVGMITGRTYGTLLIRKRRREGWISNLFVLPECRHKGVASKLVRELLEWFRRKRIKDIRLAVNSGNSAALEMFSKLGFREYLIQFEMTL